MTLILFLSANAAGVWRWFMDISGEWLWGATAYFVRVMLGLPVALR